MRRRIPPAVFIAIVLLLILGRLLHQQGFIQHQPEHQYHQPQPQPQQTEQVRPAAPAPSAPPSAESLTKYGNPVPHKLVGPYHVLVNDGYVSGYDAGIQDPRWVETRFFAVSNPSSAGRPEGFSPDPRIEPEYQVNTHYWTATGYDRGHMAPNWGVSICYGRDAQVETFLLTNVIPQSPALNRGLWETL